MEFYDPYKQAKIIKKCDKCIVQRYDFEKQRKYSLRNIKSLIIYTFNYQQRT